MAWVIWHRTEMKKTRKAKKRPAKKRKLDVNQLAAALVRRTIEQSER
jgi:hypothetical protein